MPSEHKQRVGAFFTDMAPTYDTVIPYFETFAARLVEAAGIGAGDRVLDMACGTGRCSVAAASATGAGGLVVGTDLAVGMAARARRHAVDAGLEQVHVTVGDAEHLAAADGRFDAVTCGFGVFFFPDPVVAMGEALRVLRPGGRFAATTFTDGVAGFAWAVDVSDQVGRPSSLQPSPVLTHDGLEAVLAEAGFGAIRTIGVEGRFVFADVEDYLAWCWSTGVRRVLSTLSEGELDRYRALSAERLEAHAVDGGFELRQPANVTIAERTA